ncbi:hypothetical protein ACFL6C_00685 [Myxococcota bacterium]
MDISDPDLDDDLDDDHGPTEVCDGWDNDNDNLIDEDTGGDMCAPDFPSKSPPDELVFRCIRGELLCTECEPETDRRVSCGCNIDRIDICNEKGRWLFGTCDGCEEPPTICECTPGEEKIQRCDSCGSECGSTCVGAVYRCDDECQWQQIGDCQTVEKQCDRDQYREENCGNCGSRYTTCDGCFWVVGKCEEQGECSPGDSETTPCLSGADACIDGYVAEIRCNAQCEWEQHHNCRGCALGTANIVHESCVPEGETTECGSMPLGYSCEISRTYSLCGDRLEIYLGRVSRIGESLGDCIGIDCGGIGDGTGDGTGDGDTTDDGTGNGNGGGGGSGDGDTTDTDGDGTGDGTGDGDTDVGVGTTPCSPGQTEIIQCTTMEGLCGVIELICTDEGAWPEERTCIADANACVPGTQEFAEVSCGNNTCGITYTLVKTCLERRDVCSFSSDWTDRRDACPECEQGDTRTVDCTTDQGQCGSSMATCTDSCQWQDGECEPLPFACEYGAERITDVSCGENTCNVEYQVMERCDGCYWDVVSDNEDEVCPPCQTGETLSIEDEAHMCQPGFVQCGYFDMICNDSCEWDEGPCPPCG